MLIQSASTNTFVCIANLNKMQMTKNGSKYIIFEYVLHQNMSDRIKLKFNNYKNRKEAAKLQDPNIIFHFPPKKENTTEKTLC